MMTLERSYSKTSTIPSLKENAFLRYFSFTMLYFAQGIPQGLLWYSFPAWFAMNGKTPVEISTFVAVIALPWSLKIIAAPFMDRFTYQPMGRRKPWLLIGQMGMAVGLLVLAMLAKPLDNLPAIMVIGFLLSIFGNLQDIATDGLAVDLLPVKQQARANGLMWGAKIFGIAATVASTSFLINHYGYFWTLIPLVVIVSTITLIPLFLKERACEKRFPWSPGVAAPEVIYLVTKKWITVFRSFMQVVFLPASLTMGIAAFFFCMGRGLIDAVLPVFTVQELGWTNVGYSSLFSTSTIISAILAMAVAGVVIDFWGKKRMISVFVFALLVLTAMMSLYSGSWTNSSLVHIFFVLFYSLDTFVTIAIFAIAMQLCWKRIAATQFALYMAISNVGLSFGAWLMGQLKQYLDWDLIFLFYALLMIFTLICIYLLDLSKHEQQIDLLMSNFLDERIKSEGSAR